MTSPENKQGMRHANPLSPTAFAIEASASLFHDLPTYPSVRHRSFVKELALIPIEGPINTEQKLPGRFVEILNERDVSIPIRDKHPYWLNSVPYNTMEIVGTSVQYFDQHQAALPKTTLPPARDMEEFINRVLKEDQPTTVDRQFEILLDITGNNVAGAANLGMLANRHLSRFGDQRAYPTLTIDGITYTPKTTDSEIYELMAKWNAKIAKFEMQHDPELYGGRQDGTGDSYYFWTHLFAALMFGNSGIKSKAFAKGNELMIFARDKIGKRGGIVATHGLSSQIGRNIGLSLGMPGN